MKADGYLISGKLGVDMDTARGREAAAIAALNILATLKEAVGLENVVQVHKVTGYVSCGPDFLNQPAVLNGASDLLVEVLGDRGKHARSAVGSNALPLGVPVEIEAIVEVK